MGSGFPQLPPATQHGAQRTSSGQQETPFPPRFLISAPRPRGNSPAVWGAPEQPHSMPEQMLSQEQLPHLQLELLSQQQQEPLSHQLDQVAAQQDRAGSPLPGVTSPQLLLAVLCRLITRLKLPCMHPRADR